MTTSFWQQSDLGEPLSCDIAIIGGGIIGTSTAYWLKKKMPSSSVLLLESRTVGFGASGRNAGFLLQGTSSNYATDISTYGQEIARALWRFTQENRILVGEQFNADTIQLRSSGSVIASGSQNEQESLQNSAEALREEGIDVTLWNSEELKAMCNAEGFHGALCVQQGASMNPLQLIRHISGLSGSRVLEYHPVFDVQYNNDHCLISTPLRQVRATRVLLALNAYLPKLLPYTSTYIRPVRAQMLSSTLQSHWLPLPVYSHEGYYYIRQSPDGRVLLGGARHVYADEEIGYEDQTTPHLQNALEAYYQTHFPTSPALSVANRWSGTMAFTPDGLPLFSEIESLPGSYWAAGFNGHGMGYGFRFGKMMAEVFASNGERDFYANLFHRSRLSPESDVRRPE